jgi:hypothetical protein
MYQCEEFPLACTIEGGAWNAFIMCVPTSEQKIQAATVWSMISYFKLKTGDSFVILLIPSSPVVEPKPVPDLKPFPVPFPTGYKKDFPTTRTLEPQGKIYDPDFKLPSYTVNKKATKEEEKQALTATEITVFIMAVIYGIFFGGNTAQ